MYVCIYNGWLISRGGGARRASRVSVAARFFQICTLQTSQCPTEFSTEALRGFRLCRSPVSLVLSTEHSWDLTTSQSSYGSCTTAPFVPCISSPWAGSKLDVTCCLSPATLFPKALQVTWGWRSCCAALGALVTSYLDALAEVLGSLVAMGHPGVKRNYHYKKPNLFMSVICSCVCVLLHCIKLPLKIKSYNS